MCLYVYSIIALEKEIEQRKVHSTRLSLSQPSDSPGSPTSLDSTDAITIEVAPQHDPTVQNLNELLQRFQKIRVSNRKANTPSRPSVLKEVTFLFFSFLNFFFVYGLN